MLETQDSDFRFRPRLCKNSPNFVADGTALHIDYKSPSDETLIFHFGIGKAREPLQFTTSSFHFAFLHSLGQKRPLDDSCCCARIMSLLPYIDCKFQSKLI